MSNTSSKEEKGYAGDLSAQEAWAILEREPAAVLIDVRSTAEWSFVGVPDLSRLGKGPVLLEWQSYPGMSLNPQFLVRLGHALSDLGTPADAPLLFLCRSGGRSRAAAMAATAAGHKTCFNVVGGFEGDLDTDRHRGQSGGWKATGLPWTQN